MSIVIGNMLIRPDYKAGKVSRTVESDVGYAKRRKGKDQRLKRHMSKEIRIEWRGSVRVVSVLAAGLTNCLELIGNLEWEIWPAIDHKMSAAALKRRVRTSRAIEDRKGPIHFTLDYPLDKVVTVTAEQCVGMLRKPVGWWRPGYILWLVAAEYARIFKAPKKHGVWGHAFEDLFIEGLTMFADGTVDVAIGS